MTEKLNDFNKSIGPNRGPKMAPGGRMIHTCPTHGSFTDGQNTAPQCPSCLHERMNAKPVEYISHITLPCPSCTSLKTENDELKRANFIRDMNGELFIKGAGGDASCAVDILLARCADVEGMAKVIYPCVKGRLSTDPSNFGSIQSNDIARAVSAWLLGK